MQGQIGETFQVTNALKSWWRTLCLVPRGQFALLCLLMIVCGATEGVGIVMLIPLLQTVSGGQNETSFLLSWGTDPNAISSLGIGGILILFVALIILRSALIFWRDLLSTQVRIELIDTLRVKCLSTLTAARWKWLISQRQTDHASMLITEISRIGVGFFGLTTLAATSATAFMYLIVAFGLSWQMTLMALLGGVPVFWVVSRRRKKSHEFGDELTKANFALQSVVQQGLMGLKTIKGQGTEGVLVNDLQEAMRNVRKMTNGFIAHSGMAKALTQIAGASILAVYVMVGLTIWPMPVATLITLVVIFGRLVPMAITIQQSAQKVSHETAALQTVEALNLAVSRQMENKNQNGKAPVLAESISISDVSLARDGRSDDALKQVTAVIPAKQVTAVVGASGSGKTTMVDLITGLLEPDSGSVFLDSTNLKNVNLAAWRQKIAYVSQDVVLFNDTIEANLTWGIAPPASELIEKTLKLVAADFVFDLPDGIKTVIGDRGQHFSGGERQRLALAQALLRQPEVLILDEATSALDRENENRIHDTLKRLRSNPPSKSMTIIIISHRYSVIECAQNVIALDKGSVLATGNRDNEDVKAAIFRMLG